MNQFRRKYFVLIVTFAVFGCIPNDSENRPEQAPAPTGLNISVQDEDISVQERDVSVQDEDASSGYDYTITVGSRDESVYAYYSRRNSLPLNEERFFRLKDNECLRLRGDQFKNVSIFASRGRFNMIQRGPDSLPGKTLFVEKDNYTPLCVQMYQCNPGNYSIHQTEVSFTEYIDKDNFAMYSVEEAGIFQNQCDYFYNIDNWMQFKVMQYVLSGETTSQGSSPSLQSQIDEWMPAQ